MLPKSSENKQRLFFLRYHYSFKIFKKKTSFSFISSSFKRGAPFFTVTFSFTTGEPSFCRVTEIRKACDGLIG